MEIAKWGENAGLKERHRIWQRAQTGVYLVTCPGISFTNSIMVATSRFRSRVITGSPDEYGVIQFVVTNYADEDVDTDFYFVVFRL